MITVTDDGTLLDGGIELIRIQVVDGTGADMFSVEAEMTCVPRVGPTCYLLARWLLRWHDHDGDPQYVPLDQAAAALGVQPTKIRQALKRGHRFGLWTHHAAAGSFTLRRRWAAR